MGVGRDVRQAVFWFQKAADQGFADAQYSLGVKYGKGEGVEFNPIQAIYWTQKAADQGHFAAKTILRELQ